MFKLVAPKSHALLLYAMYSVPLSFVLLYVNFGVAIILGQSAGVRYLGADGAAMYERALDVLDWLLSTAPLVVLASAVAAFFMRNRTAQWTIVLWYILHAVNIVCVSHAVFGVVVLWE